MNQHAWLGADGSVYQRRWSGPVPVAGLYVHPVTRLLRYAPELRFRFRGGPFLAAQAVLRAFGVAVSTSSEIRRYRVDGARVWERRDRGWFIHTYRQVPEQLVRVITRSDGCEVPIYSAPRYELVATKQAGKKEIQEARGMLERDPLASASE